MPEPTHLLAALRASTADLVVALENSGWSDADVREPSLCEGWTRAHVLTHLARNADAIALTLGGALRGEVVPRYASWAARDADIEAGAGRPAAELVADLRDAGQRLDRVLGAFAEDDRAWDRITDLDQPAHAWVPRRLGEVEIHRVDLATEYGPRSWPPLLVSTLLARVGETLPARAPGPLTVRIAEEGSIVPELAGRTWTVDTPTGGDAGGGPSSVEGPDWAVLAWLVGRTSVVDGALGEVPELGPWR